MRTAILLLFLLSASWAVSFGQSRLMIERAWEIEADGGYDFSGALAANDGNQRIASVAADPGMGIVYGEDGSIRVTYHGNGSAKLHASAIVDVSYDTNITTDARPSFIPIGSGGLASADYAISDQAREIAHGDSSLRTIRDLTEWVHGNMSYDADYFGRLVPAATIFRDRKGVCVEYTHLFMAMARSLGFDARYVAGYVYAGAWQPHAWAEVYIPGYGWLPVDPTLEQIGILDSSHFALSKGADGSDVYDLLVSEGPDASLSVEDLMHSEYFRDDQKGVSISIDIDDDLGSAEVSVENSRAEYVFGAYSLSLPEGFGGTRDSVLLLEPSMTKRMFYGLNRSLFLGGAGYPIPIKASFNDASSARSFSLEPAKGPGIGYAEDLDAPFFVIAAIVIIVTLTARRWW
ncbi:MAG: transglutaminase domain-containing protein [Candidatus Micrarchaeota archaeon]